MSEWNVYPRPYLVRDSFFSLNGEWDFGVSREYGEKIIVPFTPETELSGINRTFPQCQKLYYKREFVLPDGFINKRVILHFDAVDQKATVYLNGKCMCTHEGGYDRFSVDITERLQKQNILEVEVEDNLNSFVLPYGKQCKKRGGMWYTAVSGIWRSVWIESVPDIYIQKIKITPTLNDALVEIVPEIDAVISLDGEKFDMIRGKCKVAPKEIINWTPENPYLYRFKIKTDSEEVSSYFALRTVGIKKIDGVNRICLNEKPYFFHGVLDQGYFMEGIFTPQSPEKYQDDINAMKNLGFNMLRKHIKIEPDVFYYYCDKIGMAVFQDMVNNSDYSFFRDTVLATVGFKRKNDKKTHKNPKTRQAFEISMKKAVEDLYNFPCICYWTVFNEGWGQFEGTRMYNLLKELDSTRIVDTASGWFYGCETDVLSEHVYFKKYSFKQNEKPVVLSEFGGYAYEVKGHGFETKKSYGYKKIKIKDEFNESLSRLYFRDVIPYIKKGLCASVLTQLSDVEDEMNGLLTYDRKVIKAKKNIMFLISERIFKENADINS